MAVAAQPITRTSATTRDEKSSALDVGLKVLAYVVLVAVAITMFLPFLFSVTTSFKSRAESTKVTVTNALVPKTWTLDAYRQVREAPVGRWFFNSALVAVIWVLGRAVADSMAGYAFARMRFPGRNLVFLMVLSTLMVPGMVTIVPKYIIIHRLHLLNTYGSITLPFLSSAFGIFLMKQFFESIPAELEEAARIDGANRYRMFAQIILPNAMPALTALAIFTFQGSWNNFLEPLLYNNKPTLLTLPVGLAYFRQQNVENWSVQMAIAVITTLPMAIFFFVFQRYFVPSNASSGIKG